MKSCPFCGSPWSIRRNACEKCSATEEILRRVDWPGMKLGSEAVVHFSLADGTSMQVAAQMNAHVRNSIIYSTGHIGFAGESVPLLDRLIPVPTHREPEPIEGWRVWRIASREYEFVDRGTYDYTGKDPIQYIAREVKPVRALFAIGIGLVQWPFREHMRAECRGGRGEASHAAPPPQPLCQCGIWAFKEREPALIKALLSTSCDSPSAAFGRVLLGGTVVETERGYRGEYAYPYEIFVPSCEWGEHQEIAGAVARELGRRYAVDATVEVVPNRLDVGFRRE